MSNQGQGFLSHFYLGFVWCGLIRGPDIRGAFTGPLVLWSIIFWVFNTYLLTDFSKYFAALLKTFEMKMDDKIPVVRRCFRTR